MKKLIPFICALIMFSMTCGIDARADLFALPEETASESSSQSEEETQVSDDMSSETAVSSELSEIETTTAETAEPVTKKSGSSGNFFFLIIGIIIGGATSSLAIISVQRMKQNTDDMKQSDTEKIKNSLKETNKNFKQLYEVSKSVCNSFENESKYISSLTDTDNSEE